LPYLWIRETLTNFLFDRRFGTRTSGVVELAELGLASEERVEYKPSGLLFLRRILPPREVNERDVFLDYGAGMGRVILQAAQYPFRRVIGVELSEQLAQTARENIERNAERLRCKDVTVVCSDAVEYEPPDDVTVVYLYNPFTGSIFARVLTKLIESVDRAPRMVRIIYANPVEEAALLDDRRFEEWLALMTDDVVFENTGPAPDGKRYEGQDAVRRVWERVFEARPNTYFEGEDIFACDDRCVVLWKYIFDTENPEAGHVRGIDVFRVRDGKVSEKLSYVKG
jgi:ketosteroid isomerase-like protein